MYNHYSECGAKAGSTRPIERTNDVIQGGKKLGQLANEHEEYVSTLARNGQGSETQS